MFPLPFLYFSEGGLLLIESGRKGERDREIV